MEQPRYLESSSAMRAKLAGAAVAALLVAVALDHWVKPLLQWVGTLPTCESLPWVRAELLVAVAGVWFVGAMAFRQGRRVWALGQTPLPDAWVWMRTRVRTGAYAKATALALFALAVLCLVGPPVLVVWHQLHVIFFAAASCG